MTDSPVIVPAFPQSSLERRCPAFSMNACREVVSATEPWIRQWQSPSFSPKLLICWLIDICCGDIEYCSRRFAVYAGNFMLYSRSLFNYPFQSKEANQLSHHFTSGWIIPEMVNPYHHRMKRKSCSIDKWNVFFKKMPRCNGQSIAEGRSGWWSNMNAGQDRCWI